MSKFEDESNKRIAAKISKIMDEEKRGFIFAPMAQEAGDHKTMVAVSFRTGNREIGKEEIVRFYATMTGIIRNFHDALPEDAAKMFAAGFPAFSVLAQHYVMGDVLEQITERNFYD